MTKQSYIWNKEQDSRVEEGVVRYRNALANTHNTDIINMISHYQLYGISKQQISAWLSISSRQLERYIKDHPLETTKHQVVERMMLIDRLMRQGIDTFGQEEHFMQWLMTPNFTLGDQCPVDMLDNYFGIEEVRKLLHKMEYSLPV